MRLNQISKYQSKQNQQSQRINPFSQSTATPSSKPTSINNIIQCLLCSQSIQQSHMCPSCCKLFCQICIKTWIKNKKSQCPSCLKPLQLSNLINCSMLGRQIQQALSKSVSKMKNPPMSATILPSPSGAKIMFTKAQTIMYDSPPPITRSPDLICDKHQLKLQYFCEQCCMALCSDCAVLSSNHLAHKICKLSQKKLKFKQKFGELQKNGTAYKLNALKLRDDINKKADKLKYAQKDKQIILNAYIEHIFRKSLQKYDDLINQKQQTFKSYCLKYETLSQIYNKLNVQIKQMSKSGLVKQGEQLMTEISQILVKDLSNKQPTNIIAKLDGEVVPQFEQKTYILDNYNYLRQKGDILVSQPLFYKGTEWILKIYPSGINNSNKLQQQFLAIHLQMLKGYQTFNWYRYRLELVNQANRSKCMSFQSQYYFKEGSEWHLDNFIPISALYTDNFINPDGYIEIILYLRCLTYYHGVQDQKQLINIKQAQINKNYTQLLTLKKKANELGIKLRSAKGSPISAKNNYQTKLSYSHKAENKRVIAIDQDVQ